MELQIAGILAIMAGIGHGYLGDATIKAQTISPPELKNFIRACYQFGSLGWIVGGALFLIAPFELHSSTHQWTVIAFIPLFAYGSLVNLWFTKGKHPGWVMLLAIVILSLLSLR